jgi:hypothetical protein
LAPEALGDTPAASAEGSVLELSAVLSLDIFGFLGNLAKLSSGHPTYID